LPSNVGQLLLVLRATISGDGPAPDQWLALVRSIHRGTSISATSGAVGKQRREPSRCCSHVPAASSHPAVIVVSVVLVAVTVVPAIVVVALVAVAVMVMLVVSAVSVVVPAIVVLIVTDAGLEKLVLGFANLLPDKIKSQAKGDCFLSAVASMHPNVTSLNLRGCNNVTDAGLEKFSAGCPNLTSLDLRNCCNVTAAARAFFPACALSLQAGR
jgi:hypothetical protein